jgi:hypothetical protein
MVTVANSTGIVERILQVPAIRNMIILLGPELFLKCCSVFLILKEVI